ncbi:MAG: prephenate dehydratase [Gemmatimonadaceae bacterium]
MSVPSSTSPGQRPSSSPVRIAFQGELGAFSEEGIRQLWTSATPVPKRTVVDVTRAVACGDVDFGLLPIENTLAGAVRESYDALAASDELHVVAETVVAVHHCLLALPGASLDQITTVESHPVALAQCAIFLERHPHLTAVPAFDTAGAARDIAQRGDRRAAAIASRAATRYSLQVLAADIEDRPDNQTRFLAIARTPATLEPGVPARTRFVLTVENLPGALYRVLTPLSEHDINLASLESRPTGEPWTHRFFFEVQHQAGDERITAACERVRPLTRSFRVLGSYPAAS